MFAVGMVVIIAGIAGCAAPASSADVSPDGEGTILVTTAPVTPEAAVTDKESCEAFGDVLTITTNADADLHDGRMTQKEHDGWYRLATRVLDRVPTSGDGTVSDTITALKEAAPAIRSGALGKSGIGTDAWITAGDPLLQACTEAGSDLVSESFTGG